MKDGPEFLTVPELAELLRIKERKVYDLAAAGTVPCNRATGKLLFPENEIRAWIATSQTGRQRSRPAVFLGSHDPLLEWALRQSQCGLATFFDGSADGLSRFAMGEGIATGLHIPDTDGDGWNFQTAKETFAQGEDVVLISWATRNRGLVFREQGAHELSSLSGLSDRRLAVRQPGAGSSVVLEKLLAEHRVERIENVGPFHSEQDAVLAVQEGAADATFGLEVVANQFGLAFTPILKERFDLLVDRAAYFEPPFQQLLEFCRQSAFHDRAKSLAGYSIQELGKVRWNA